MSGQECKEQEPEPSPAASGLTSGVLSSPADLVAVVAHDRQALAIVIAKNIQSLIERRIRGDETLDEQSGTPDTVKPATISARFRLRQDRQKRNRRRIPCRATINPCRQSSSRTAIVSFFTATIIAPFMSMSVMVEA